MGGEDNAGFVVEQGNASRSISAQRLLRSIIVVVRRNPGMTKIGVILILTMTVITFGLTSAYAATVDVYGMSGERRQSAVLLVG
jgi:hypothetical protein